MPGKKPKDKSGSAGRFGPRYGTRVRARVKGVEVRAKGYHNCPECGSKKVKKSGTGIWECKRCGAKFAARANTPDTTSIEKKISEESTEEIIEEVEE